LRIPALDLTLFMLRIFARLLGFLALGGGLAAGVVDGARLIADEMLEPTPMGSAISWLAPRFSAGIEPFVTRIVHPLMWDPVLVNFLAAPAVLVLFVSGTLLLIAGIQKQTPVTAPE
jgi:hypothetical protein